MVLRQAWFYNTDAVVGDGSNYFLIPSDCSMVWATGCGGGGGGATVMGSTGFGGTGGSASMFIWRYPLAVKPNGYLVVSVGRGTLGAYRYGWGYSNNGPNGETENTAAYFSTVIVGDLVGPDVWSDLPYFTLGYASGVPPTVSIYGKGTNLGSNTELVFITAYNTPHFPINTILPSSTGEFAGIPFGTTTAGSAPAGRMTGNQTGIGAVGAYGPQFGAYASQSSGTFGYSDGGMVGAGGAGGGGPFGTGGGGGIPWVNGGQGGDAVGYGCGGGGGCWGAPGGNGGDGFLLLEY